MILTKYDIRMDKKTRFNTKLIILRRMPYPLLHFLIKNKKLHTYIEYLLRRIAETNKGMYQIECEMLFAVKIINKYNMLYTDLFDLNEREYVEKCLLSKL